MQRRVRSFDTTSGLAEPYLLGSSNFMMRRKLIQSISTLLAAYGLPGVAVGKPSTGQTVKPRHVICFLGEWKSLELVGKIVTDFGKGFSLDREYSMTERDLRMETAFAASQDLVSKTFSEEDWKRVRRHNSVAYVLSPPVEKDKALAVSTAALELTARLIKVGATAVKSESAGIAHGLSHWMLLAEKNALREAWVRRPIKEAGVLYSCGMHLLGLPDIECIGTFQDRDAVRWIDAISDESLAGRIIPKRFSIDNLSPKKSIDLVPCKRYAEDDFFFNPYGYFRVKA